MGGYAGFVWPAYALAAIVLVGLLVGQPAPAAQGRGGAERRSACPDRERA